MIRNGLCVVMPVGCDVTILVVSFSKLAKKSINSFGCCCCCCCGCDTGVVLDADALFLDAMIIRTYLYLEIFFNMFAINGKKN